MYIKNSLKYTHKIVNIGDLKAIEINISFKEKNFNLTALYKLHQINKEKFIDDMNKYLAETNYNEHIVLGDININISKMNDTVHHYLNTISLHGFTSAMN